MYHSEIRGFKVSNKNSKIGFHKLGFRVWSYLVKSEVVGSREQWKSAVDGRNRRSQLGIGGRSSESAVAGLKIGGLRRGCRWAMLRRRRWALFQRRQGCRRPRRRRRVKRVLFWSDFFERE